MDFIIANVEHLEFKIERDLNEQYGSLPLPFAGMDSKFLAFCRFFSLSISATSKGSLIWVSRSGGIRSISVLLFVSAFYGWIWGYTRIDIWICLQEAKENTNINTLVLDSTLNVSDQFKGWNMFPWFWFVGEKAVIFHADHFWSHKFQVEKRNFNRKKLNCFDNDWKKPRKLRLKFLKFNRFSFRFLTSLTWLKWFSDHIFHSFCVLFFLLRRIDGGGVSIFQQYRWLGVSTGCVMSIPSHSRRSNDCVQALVAWPVQKGWSMWIFAWVRHDQNARVLLLFAFQCVPQQRVSVLAHRSGE